MGKNELTLTFKDQLSFDVAPGFGTDSDVMLASVYYSSFDRSEYLHNLLFDGLSIDEINQLRQILDTVANFMLTYPQRS